MADIKQYVKAAEEKMTFAIEYLDEQLSHIRAGKANPKSPIIIKPDTSFCR